MSAITHIIGSAGRRGIGLWTGTVQVSALITDTLEWTVWQPARGRGFRFRSTVEHFVEFGVNSLPIVGLICFLVGAILAMQSAYQLSQWGAEVYIANLVGVAAVRELAPLMTAILLAGRSGSAITAEIGTMKVSEELDALEVMGVNPVKYLVVPKFVAMTLAIPCLTLLATFIMIAGGYWLSVHVLGIDATLYIDHTVQSLGMKDFATGFTKSVFFAFVICWVGVYRGFQVEGGAEGVGRMTTSSVVTAIFFIIMVDLVFTALFFF
jgi:phospholipid/cholesterol/gamma-HCH transport system permease protein